MNAQSRVALGVLSPSQAQAFAAQGAGLQNAYATALAGIKAQGGQVRSDFQSAQADVKTQLISDVSGAEAAAQQAGVLGGSVDAANRTGAVLTAAATRQDNLATRNAALAQLRLQKLQASNDLYTGLAGLAGDRAAAEAELTAQRFQQDAYDAMQTNYHQLYQDILRRLLAKRGGGDGGNGDGGNGGQPGWADQLPPGAYVDPNNGDVYTGYGRNRRV
jgi:oligoendopeptidase F